MSTQNALISGSLAGMTAAAAGQPFDTVKVKLQTTANNPSVFVQEFKKNGIFRTLYGGVHPAMLASVMENSALFVANSAIKSVLNIDTQNATLFTLGVTGGLAGIFSSIVITPAELIKVKMQASHYPSTVSCFKDTIRKEGPSGLFKSLPSQVIRDVPFNAIFIGSFEAYARGIIYGKNLSEKSELNSLDLFVSGAMAGSTAWLFTIPMDIVKSRVSITPKTHSNMEIRVAKQIYRDSGFKGFFRGLAPTLVRSIPVNGALFCSYEMTERFLNESVV